MDHKPRPAAADDLAEVVEHYERRYDEAARLAGGLRALELLRTQEVIRRHLPSGRLRVLDVGGGTGAHATWLAGGGHDVLLVDPVPRHVAAASGLRPDAGSITATLGDARHLDVADAAFDAVLLLGPLYHLQERSDRLDALREAGRALAPGGVLFVAAISRYASLHDGLSSGFLFEQEFRSIVEQDLRTGRHRNPEGHADWFTTAFFHLPEELRAEITDAGLAVRELVGLEGLACWLPQLGERWADPTDRAVIVAAARQVETEPTLLGVSAHLLAVATQR